MKGTLKKVVWGATVSTVLIGWLMIIAAGTLHAAGRDESSPTAAESEARVAVLEQDLARLQQDYQLLLTTACPSQPPSAAPSAGDRFERAASEQRAVEEANRAAVLQQQQRLEDMAWYVRDLDFGVTERNNVFVRFGWKVTVRNGIPRRQTVRHRGAVSR